MTEQVPSQKPATQLQELSPDQLEHAGAGTHVGGVLVGLGDGSVRTGDGTVDSTDYVVWRKQ
jgi:hypothetical protein